MTNMRVIEHRWLLNNTKNTGQQSTSWANTLIFRPSLITLFKAELAVQMYICQWLLQCTRTDGANSILGVMQNIFEGFGPFIQTFLIHKPEHKSYSFHSFVLLY